MNTGLFVLVIGLAWTVTAVAVALAVGAMARARDAVPALSLPRTDESLRTAV